jgi:hypothetical protein
MSVDELAECINPEIDECMCITESIREWEEDNREELDETPHEFSTTGTFTIEGGIKGD